MELMQPVSLRLPTGTVPRNGQHPGLLHLTEGILTLLQFFSTLALPLSSVPYRGLKVAMGERRTIPICQICQMMALLSLSRTCPILDGIRLELPAFFVASPQPRVLSVRL